MDFHSGSTIRAYRCHVTALRGPWCDVVLNVHVPTEDKIDDMKDSFYWEQERVFYKFPKYYKNILLGNLNAKVDREHISKLTVGNESMKLLMIMESE
jgi:hypothetical protein